MKKRLFITTLAAFLIFTFTLAVPVYAQQVTAITNGFTNVEFSNGYFGYCIDRDLYGAYINDVFNTSDTSIAKSNIDNSDISQYLKILFTQHFSDLFVSDGNGGYVIDSNKKDSVIPQAIYNLSDGQYIWGESKTLINSTKAYTGPAIPDEGYTKALDNGDVITFYFIALEPENNDQQTFFAYKIAVNEQPTHTHNFSTEWTSDDDSHWHECACGEKEDLEAHEGNEPDCVTPSICIECAKEFEGVSPDNHTGNVEIRNADPATEFKDGYTGDKHCEDCGALLEKGTRIPATHVHDFDEENWKSDDDEHWHECDCGEKEDVESHNFKDNKCICGKEINDNTNTNGNGNNNVEQNEIPNTSVVPNIGSYFILLLLSTIGLAFITYRKKEHGII